MIIGQVEESLSRHSRVRCSQRSIPPRVVEWLLDFGSMRRTYNAEIWIFDKKARARLRSYLGGPVFDRLDKLLNIYAVVQDGHVITVGHRLKRFLSH